METETVGVTAAVSREPAPYAVGEHTYTSAEFDNPAFSAQSIAMDDIPPLGLPINEYTFPDEAFRNEVSHYDKDSNGHLTDAEREAVKTIYIISNTQVQSLAGIEYFPDLKHLVLMKSCIADVDVSQNPNLQRLQLDQTQFTHISLIANTELTYLRLCNGPLASISLEGLTKLDYLCLMGTQISSLDLSDAHVLSEINVANCPNLTELDLSSQPNLYILSTYGTGITMLDLRGAPHLTAAAAAEPDTSNEDYDYYLSGSGDILRVNKGTRFMTDTSGWCGDEVSWTLNGGTLTITGTGAMWDYTFSDHSMFYEREDISAVVIESGVTHIGAYLFHGCHGIESVSIPDSVSSVGSSAFIYCTHLNNVVIPEGRLIDQAPTYAKLLGVELPGADGVPMDALLR